MKRVLIAAFLSLSLSARAQETADDAKKAAVLEEARQHVAKAKVHYDLGEFKEAADEYIIVYRLRPIPALLFNIAQAYRLKNDYSQALHFYQTYLNRQPKASNRADAEAQIAKMQKALKAEPTPAPVAAPPVAAPPVAAPPVSSVARNR